MDLITYACLRKFVKDTAIGMGAVKGKNCLIQSIVANPDSSTTVTFKWELDDGQIRTAVMNIPSGKSITEVTVNSQNHLICTTSDGESIDAGEIKPIAKITAPITATENIGTITSGKTFPVGTDIEEIIKEMLVKYQPPTVSLSLVPDRTLYDVVTETVSEIRLKAATTKKTKPITKIEFYVGSTLVNTVTSGVSGGGTFSYDYVPAQPINTNTTFKAVVYDNENKSSSSTKSIKFVANSYSGIADASVSDPSATVIKSGTSTLKDVRNFVFNNITTSWGKPFYAYPKEFGALTYIKDEPNNINYFDSFQQSEVVVDGINYYCYTLIDPTAAEGNSITFK